MIPPMLHTHLFIYHNINNWHSPQIARCSLSLQRQHRRPLREPIGSALRGHFEPLSEKDAFFYVHVTVYRNKIFLIKPTDALISQIYFCQESLHVSDSSSAHHQEFSTVHSALVHVMQF
jgi:hypothetical protein